MVYSSCAIVPKSEDADAYASNDVKCNSAQKKDHNSASPSTLHPSSSFVDSKGNLKFVNVVVAYPCAIFLVILGICLVIVVALSKMAFADGNPFTPSTNAYDLFDVRSIAYDSLRLAHENVTKELQISLIGEGTVFNDSLPEESVEPEKLQENLGDLTYWIYEAKKDAGLFTKEALEHMRTSENMLTKHARYPNYCWHQRGKAECRMSKSVVNIFYASQWNSTIAHGILSQLTEEKIRLYNSLASCVELNYLCDFIPSDATEDDKNWVRELAFRINSMMMHWDGEGELNKDLDEVSKFLAVMNELYTKAPVVQFFLDTNFTVDNPVTMYTRSVVYWGAPLSGANDKSPRSDDTSQGLLKK